MMPNSFGRCALSRLEISIVLNCVFSAFGNLVLVRLPQPFSDIEEEFKRLLVLSGWTVVPEEKLEWKVFPNPDSRVYDAFFDYS